MFKIALLDDYQDFCLSLEYLLSDTFDVQSFTDTNIFLKKVESERYDLVLIDFSIISIPEQGIHNGCNLIEYIKERLKEPPLLILFTGWISRNALEEGKKICPMADGFLAKDS
ncbi:MAG TPA: hypothetical protein DCP31_02335, partial [Cyanobacteria bacterium UBA8543]|nr:hypothetical protein [Cyanobacteria bacterium UBA8543]